MSTHKQLRTNKNQHKPKNIKSKKDDKILHSAMNDCIDYLKSRFEEELKDDYYFEFKETITFNEMFTFVKSQKIRRLFDNQYKDNIIKPDGGIIWLRKKSDKEYKKPVIISEIKRQGTNDERLREGKKKTSTR